MIDVMLVDDHALLRAGLATLIEAEDDLRVVASAADGHEALDLLERCRPDVVLMDLSMPGMDGVTATRRIIERYPAVQVLALTSFTDRDRVLAALDAGAVGYLLKDSDPADLVRGIHAVVRGESPLDARVTRAVLSRTPARRVADQLTGREREVLRLVSQGMANKQIARSLGIGERTVKAHLTSAFQRIGVADRTSAALWAQRHLGSESGG